MVRPTRILRQAGEAAKSAQASGKIEPMSADHTLYHLAPTGFWKKFRDAVVVNPEISSGLPLPDKNRYPQPGSRTERYATPATQASDPAFNPYYKRDVRRNYPQTSTITQSHLSSLLLSSPSLASLPSPPPTSKLETMPNAQEIAPSADAGNATRAVVTSSVPGLTEVLSKLPNGSAFFGSGISTGTQEGSGSGSGLPPVPPVVKRWVPQEGGEIPHDEHAYFPMIGYK